MFTPLAKTYEPLLAQRAAGALRAHGIAAWVTHDAPSGSDGTVAAGGCRLMVAETDAAEAERILESNPLPAVPSHEPRPRRPFTLLQSLGAGFVQGALWLPLLAIALQLLQRTLAALRWAGPSMRSELPVFANGFFHGILTLSLTGALLGLIAGVAAWLLSSYRRHGKTGFAFVLFIVLVIAVPELLYLLTR